MQEIDGNIWDYADQGWIIVTTNSVIKSNGEAVMGRGIALEAAQRFPNLPKELATRLRIVGNYINYFPEYKIITFPTKRHWKDKSDLSLIVEGAKQLRADLEKMKRQQREMKYFLPRLGCGNGGLEWHNVKEAVSAYLDEPEFTFVHPKSS